MRTGQRVELLVAVRDDARWLPGTVARMSPCLFNDRPVRYDVRLDDGRLFDGCHVDSIRAIVSEPA